jgi:hypothetical protein
LFVELEMDNAKGELLPGGYAEVHFKLPIDDRGVRVSANALLFWAQGPQRAPLLFGPTESRQVETVPVVELDTFLFQQAPLQGIAAIAGEGVGNLAFRIDDAVPRNVGGLTKILKHLADKTGPPWQASHRGDLAIGGNPSARNAADHSANRSRGFAALGWDNLGLLTLRRHRQLSLVAMVRSPDR